MSVDEVKKNITKIYERKAAALYALSVAYAAEAIQIFRSRQRGGAYWENQTGDALALMFAKAFQTADSIGFFLAHGVSYGVYLELANDRRNMAILPIIIELWKPYADAVERIYGTRGQFRIGGMI